MFVGTLLSHTRSKTQREFAAGLGVPAATLRNLGTAHRRQPTPAPRVVAHD